MSINIDVEINNLAYALIDDEYEFLELLCTVFNNSEYDTENIVKHGYDGSNEHNKLPDQLRKLADAIEIEIKRG